MKRNFWLQLIGISLFFTVISSALAIAIFQHVAAGALQENRQNTYRFLANIVDGAPYQEALQQYERYRADSHTGDRRMWVLSASGQVLAANTAEVPPADWTGMEKPVERHAITAKTTGFSNFADLVLVRLDGATPTFLLVRPEKDSPNRAIASAEIWVFVLSLFGTSMTGLTILFVYLRRTSHEARQVIQRLHDGDLAARFDIGRFDEIGSLKLDFNAMADQIETLIERIKVTENSRRELLQELSHDLRTPLTSLRTSVETLHQFRDKMSADQQQETLQVAQGELDYFMRLLEDLFFIANLPEPGYESGGELVDLHDLCDESIQAREVAQPQVHWYLQDRTGQDACMVGSAHLMLRLLRNVLDNAVRFANYEITITLQADPQYVYLIVEDDGPGMDAQAAELFGKRRKQRIHGAAANANISLGLGSVIITAITALHGGTLTITNRSDSASGASGAVVQFRFPRAQRDPA